MSKELVCHFSPDGGIDDKIAKVLNYKYSKEDIGILRGLYDMDHKKPLVVIPEGADERKMFTDSMEVLKAISKLFKYKNSQIERHKSEMQNTTAHMAKTFNQLYHVPGWDLVTRRNRINMIATEFSAEVSRRMKAASKAGIPLTREQIVNGYKQNGKYHDGQLSIFESIFDRFIDRFTEAREIIEDFDNLSSKEKSTLDEEDYNDVRLARKIVTEYPKIIQNWAALCTFARMSLRNTESLKLGQTLEYAAPTTPDNFVMDSPMEDAYNLEESVREAWMSHHTETSAFGSMGSEVRRFLSTITDVDADGNEMTDDLGYKIKMDPVETHQYLAEILRGITSESGLVRKLYSLSKSDPKIKAVFEALSKSALVSLKRKDATGREVLKPISDSNKPGNPTILTQLLVDMHKNMVPFSALVRQRGGDIIAKILNKKSNPLYDEFTMRMQINQQLDSFSSIYDDKGSVDWEKLAQWNVENQGLLTVPDESNSNNVFDNQKFAGFYNASYAERIDYMKRAARALGIPMDDNSARRIYNNASLRKAYLTALQEFRTETRNAYDGDVLKALKIIENYKGFLPSVNLGHTAEQREEYQKALETLKSKNISYREFIEKKYGKNQKSSEGAGKDRIYKILNSLAEVKDYLKTERRVPWFDRKGKTNSRYSDLTPSYMGDLVDKIHEFVNEEDAQGLKDFIMDKWGQSTFFYDRNKGRFLNKWLQELYDSIEVDNNGKVTIDNNALAKVFEFNEFLGSNIDRNVTIFENFTEKQHAEAMLKQFVQAIDQSKGKSKLAKYPCFILGDSGSQRFFTAKRYSRDEILEGLKDTFNQEIERMKYVNAVNKILERDGYKPVDNFSQTANEFTMLKFLNPEFADGKYWEILTGEKGIPDGRTLFDVASESINTDALTQVLQTYMEDALAEFKHKLASVGVLVESKGEGDVITYTDPKGYFAKNIKWFDNSIDNLVSDFFWNTKYATIQQLQLFTVDPAFYDHRYPIKDLQKRYKEIYAPGKGVSIEARDYNGNLFVNRPYEKAAYFDDISVSVEDINPAFWNVLKKAFKDRPDILNLYKDCTLTDGQGYRTLDSYRAVKGMAGEWTMAMEEAYNRIKAIKNSGRTLTDADIKEMAQLAVVLQPIKPYLYTLEKLKISEDGQPDDFALIPVQHKYAEVVLIPELLQDGKLKEMALWMENNDVDLLASTKCVKVGAFGSASLKGANTSESIQNALNEAFIHNLSWADYRIQSGVPEHLNHAQLFGTQIRKLILERINKSHNYLYLNNILGKSKDPLGPTVYLPGMGNVHLSGRNLISFYNCLIMANLFDSYERFTKDTATNQALSDKMLQNIISNASQSEDNAFGLSIIEDGVDKGEFVIPLGEPGMEHDAAALLWSLFKKGINKQKILGGSAVQASALGLSGYEEAGDLFEVTDPDSDNVLYDEIEMPWNRTYTSATGKVVQLKFEDWCNPDGTLKMSDQIVYGEDAKEYLSWPVSGRNEFGKAIDPSQGYYIPLIETKYKGILDIIAYRIPTEKEYSMINAKVFRFSNPLAGGTMKVPSSRTRTAGFDFDIDKLYFFMKEFAQTHLSSEDIETIWSKIYDLKYDRKGHVIEGNDIYKALIEARKLDREGKEYLSELAEEFDRSELPKEVSEEENENGISKLHQYWEMAGLEGSDSEAFTKYLEDHRDEYPIFDTYDPAVSPLDNSRASRNNMLIDLMRQRLMDEETLASRYTPGGFENNREAALRMRVLQFADKADITTDGKIDWSKVDSYVDRIHKGEIKDPEPEYDPSDPTAILVYNQQNQVAGKLIGIFANQNTNHVYASTMHELALREPIKFGNHAARGLYDLLHAPDGVDVDTNMAEYLAASVDAVKDPVLNFLNLNLTTADAGALLARIGYTPQEIGLLFNQPVIKELCNYIANEGVSTDIAISEMLRKYGGKNASLKKINYDATNTTSERLANNILEGRDINPNSKLPAAFTQGQLQVLWLFNELMANTADVNSFVQCTRFTAANSVGSTWGDQLAQEERVRTFIEKYMKDYGNGEDPRRLSFMLFDPAEIRSNRVVHAEDTNMEGGNQGILNISEELLDLSPEEYMSQMSRNPLAFEQCMMDLARKTSRTLFKKHFPYYTQLYNNMRNIMRRLTKYGGLDADTINSLHRDFMLYALSKQKGSAFDGEASNALLPSLTNREYYTKNFPWVIHTLKSEGVLDGIPLFGALTVIGDIDADAESNPLKVIIQGMGGLQTKTSNMITEAWAAAFESNAVVHSVYLGIDIPIKQLAQDLYFYNIYKLGFNYHPTSSISLAPTILKLGLRMPIQESESSYIEFIRSMVNGNITMDSNDLISFAKQYILNHLDNKKFVFTPKGQANREVINKAYNEQGAFWNSSFSISLNSLGDDIASLFTIKDESLKGEAKAFRPVIALEKNGNTAYYMADSNGARFNVVDPANGSMTYKLVHAQGVKGQYIQYFGNAAFNAYQRDGSLEDFGNAFKKDGSFNENYAGEEGTDGTPGIAPEGTHIEAGTDVSNMFTEAEWKTMLQKFREKYPLEGQGIHDNDIRRWLSNTSDTGALQILNELVQSLDRGEEMETIDDEGKPIKVC